MVIIIGPFIIETFLKYCFRIGSEIIFTKCKEILKINNTKKKTCSKWTHILNGQFEPEISLNIFRRLDHQSFIKFQSRLGLEKLDIGKLSSYQKNQLNLQKTVDFIQPSTKTMMGQYQELTSINLLSKVGIVQVLAEGNTVCLALSTGMVHMFHRGKRTQKSLNYQGRSDIHIACGGKILLMVTPWQIFATDVESDKAFILNIIPEQEMHAEGDNDNYPAFHIKEGIAFHAIQGKSSLHVYRIDLNNVVQSDIVSPDSIDIEQCWESRLDGAKSSLPGLMDCSPMVAISDATVAACREQPGLRQYIIVLFDLDSGEKRRSITIPRYEASATLSIEFFGNDHLGFTCQFRNHPSA